jgi:hypothetical protein
VNLIELHLKLGESHQLKVELFAHLAELIFNGGKDINPAWHRSCRTAFARGPAAPGSAARTLFAFRPPSSWFRHLLRFYANWGCVHFASNHH